jgi:hypothetical protein
MEVTAGDAPALQFFSNRDAVVPRLLHASDKRLGFRKNHRLARLRASKFFHGLHRIEAKQRNEFNFLAFFADKQFRTVISGDVSRGDAREISFRSMFSYTFASAGLVHPCQIRAIIV